MDLGLAFYQVLVPPVPNIFFEVHNRYNMAPKR